MVCLQELTFLSVFHLDLNQNTHEDYSTTPENASFSYTFSVGHKKAYWMLWGFVRCLVFLQQVLWAVSPCCLASVSVCLLPFVILPVLVPKYPFPIFYHISSKSINKPSLALPCASFSLQTLKQHFSRALQSRMQVQGLDLHQKKNENYRKHSSF